MWYTEKDPERAREMPGGGKEEQRRGREERSRCRGGGVGGGGERPRRETETATETEGGETPEQRRELSGLGGYERLGCSGGYRQWLRLIFPGSSRSSVVSTSHGNLLSAVRLHFES